MTSSLRIGAFQLETKHVVLTAVWFDTWHCGERQRAVESVYKRV